MKDPFDKSFFTDPDFMKKEFKKTDRQFKIFGLVAIILYVIIFISIAFTINSVSNQIKSNGGIGKTIGGFIKDIKESSK